MRRGHRAELQHAVPDNCWLDIVRGEPRHYHPTTFGLMTIARGALYRISVRRLLPLEDIGVTGVHSKHRLKQITDYTPVIILSRSIMEESVDVLIVGGGPTGGMLALELAMQGVSFRIIDAAAARPKQSRAFVLHSRTQELLNRHGEGMGRLTSRGKVNMALRMFSNKKFVFEMDLSEMGFEDTMFPVPLIISQAETEKFLDDELLNYGKSVERPVAAERIEQDNDGATAWLRHENGSGEVVHCKYVVGCDGAHSLTRKSTGLKFEGGEYPQDFVLADVHLNWTQPADFGVFLGSVGFMAIFPMRDGVFRLILSRPRHFDSDTEPTLRDFEDAFADLVPGDAELFDAIWITRFRLHHRNVENYRAGRIFMAGDAAHIHSPAGGQGMNAGMQDSVNLGWKLASVLRGEKDDSFLDTYNIERHRIGEHLLHGTDRLFYFMSSRNPIYLYLRNTLAPWIVPWVLRDRTHRAKRFRFISQLGIRYRHSPIVGTSSASQGTLRGGDRAPDGKLIGIEGPTTVHGLCRDHLYHLLLFSGTEVGAVSIDSITSSAVAVVAENKNRIKLHVISHGDKTRENAYSDPEGIVHGLYGCRDPGYVLVRPDGHISFIGPMSHVGELGNWLAE